MMGAVASIFLSFVQLLPLWDATAALLPPSQLTFTTSLPAFKVPTLISLFLLFLLSCCL